MRTFLPGLLAGLWLFSSCSSDTTGDEPGDKQPDPGVATNYSIFLEENGTFSLQDISADALDIEALGTVEVNASAAPLFSGVEQSVFAILLPSANCGVDVLIYSPQTSTTHSILTGLEACTVDILGFAQSLQASYILYADEDPISITSRYTVRRISADGMDFTDIELPGRAIDLDISSGKLFVLAYLSEAETESALLEFNADLSGTPELHPVSTGGKLLTSLGTDRLLLGYEDAHQIYNSATMSLVDNILYQPGTEPGFTYERPLSDPSGNLLYYLFDDPQTPAKERIAAIYDSNRRTLVLYLVENFLSPDQREFQFDVGSVTAVGYDSENGLLIIGYARATSVNHGGLLRLKLEPEFQFLDQLDLPAVPRMIYTNR
ncbi:hypothetical protein SAMN04490243_1703 [Robiginitalea myxolifaciens]|uniref:TolB-like 6-blade propeller-like n=1 Tax=Robiginitalea myxolifaciens TaxID=400055 RepID=A0A1I6GTN9_9FLAO|nr:hypothetical protein [Robiginitalea myxolifaciens]SFR45451.1 hypothetical protein SAMN04490243_1703 [Robiginitalea myxolifaciens]